MVLNIYLWLAGSFTEIGLLGAVILFQQPDHSCFLPDEVFNFCSMLIYFLLIIQVLSPTSLLRCIKHQNSVWMCIKISLAFFPQNDIRSGNREPQVHFRLNSLLKTSKILSEGQQWAFHGFSRQQKVQEKLCVWVFITFSFWSPLRCDKLPNWSFVSDIIDLQAEKEFSRINFMEESSFMTCKLHLSQYF